ncbi:ankyrin repeat-containing domain protein [Chytriomyces sp. MP71]|nr:ankyrin repeat-containing domain protein [Chytriomyces sp. MP71]
MDLEERRFAFEQKRWTEQFELAKSMHIDVSAIGGGSLLLPGPREGSAGMMMRNAVKDSPPREVPIVEAPRKSIAPKKGPIKKTIFISYCWQNSRRQMEMDVTAGKKPASVIDDAGVTDPRMIYDILKSQGWDVWLDVVKLGAGQPLIDQLAEAIRNEAGIVIVHASDAYADSANCKKEYFFAQKMKLPMIPLIVGKSPSADTGREDEKTESVEVAEPPADTTSAAAKKIANEKRDKRIVGVEKRKPVSDKAVNKPKLPSWDYTWLGMDISPTLYIDARNPNDQEGAINQLIEAIESKLKEVDGDADSESGLDLNTLRDAVNAGAVEEARKFIADGYDVNKFNTDKKELPLIHVAVAKDNAEMVKLLLDCGAEVEAKGLLERTPIIAAAGHGSPEVISILLAMGANVNSYDSNKSTALHLAAASNTKEVCKLLLEKNASLEVQDKIGYTTLFSAVAALNIETTQLLIENGADISVIEPVRKQSLMHCAAGTEPTADGITVVKYLVSAGCDKDQRDIHNFTPLIWAIHEGHVEIAQYLLSLGGAFDGTLDTSDDNNYEHENNIIQLCAHYGYLELLQSIVPLVSRDVLLNKTNQNGWTAMTYTVARGYVNMAKFLHSVSPLFINEKTSNKMNLISIASSYGQLETLQWLLSESGIRYSLEDADSSLLTPIMHSISGKNMAVFDYLREKGAKLDVCMPNMVKNEVNIVQICCSAGNIEFLKKILEVEPSLKKQLYEVSPYNGWSTMMYAISSNSVEMVEFLHSLGVDFSSLSSDGDSVTENICEFGSVEMLRAVLKLDASSINSPNYFGLTPLMETIMSTTEQNAAAGTLVNALLEHGALFNVGGFDAMNLLNELVSKDSLRSDNTDLIKLICAHIPDTVTLDDMDNYDQLCLKVIECKDLGLLKSIISHGIELSKRNTCYLADLLCSAASIGHVEIFKFLKNQIPAMSINDAGSREKRPIDCAAEEGAVEMIEYLHQIGATFETHGDEEDTLLHLAVQSSKLQCVKAVVKLIPQSVNIDSVNKAFRTPMTNAIESGNFDIVKYLLSEGASLSFKAPNGDSCLHIAFSNATAETKDMIQFLLQNMPASFSLNDENDNGISCLTLALRNEENEALLKLIVTQSKLSWSLSPNGKKNIFEAFLNVWSPNPAGILPILKAVQEPSLINVKAGQNTTLASKVLDSSGYSNDVLSFLKHLKALNFAHFNDPKLFFSALQNHGNMIEILEFLLSCLSPEALPEVINAADDELVTLMGHAALYSNLKAVKVLHAAGSTLACRSTIGRNLLHFACAASKSSESKAILEFLIDKVSPSILNERDNDGWTPLYQAFKTPNLDAVPILLSHGADVTILANDGTSVYDAWLALYDEDFTLESFKALSATWKTSIDLLDDGGNTALAIFARKGDIESMKECLAMGASLDWRQPGSGLNLAGFAAQDAEFDSIKFLETVIPGCCMVENERGQNALTISLQEGHLHIFEYILAKAPTLSNSVRKELLFQAAIHGHAGYVKQFMTEESSSMLEEKIDVWHLTPCNGCSKNEGSEIRYRCFTCNIDDDCYLCESCLPKAEEIHKPNHNFCPVTDTLLTVSVSMGQDNVAHVLLQGATSLSDAVTSTLLTFACMRGFLDLIQIVLKMGICQNSRTV